jgi:hypothetical protein
LINGVRHQGGDSFDGIDHVDGDPKVIQPAIFSIRDVRLAQFVICEVKALRVCDAVCSQHHRNERVRMARQELNVMIGQRGVYRLT